VERLTLAAKRCAALDDAVASQERASQLQSSLERVLWARGVAELRAMACALLLPPPFVAEGKSDAHAAADTAAEPVVGTTQKSTWWSTRSAAMEAADEAAHGLTFDLGFSVNTSTSKATAGEGAPGVGTGAGAGAGAAGADTSEERRRVDSAGAIEGTNDYSFLSSLPSAGAFLTPGVLVALLPLARMGVVRSASGAAADGNGGAGGVGHLSRSSSLVVSPALAPHAALRSFLSRCVEGHLLPTVRLGYETHIQEAVTAVDAFRPFSGLELERRGSVGAADMPPSVALAGGGEASNEARQVNAKEVLASIAAAMRPPPPLAEVPVPVLRSAAVALHELEALSTAVPGYAVEVLSMACGTLRVLLAECHETLDLECGNARARALLDDSGFTLQIQSEPAAALLRRATGRQVGPTNGVGDAEGGSALVDAAPPPELLQRVLSEAPVPVDELLCDSEAAALLACMSSGLLALASRADELEWAATKALRGAAKGSPEAAVPAAVAQVAADCRRLARRCLMLLRVEMLLICANASCAMRDAEAAGGRRQEGALEVEEGVLACVRQIATAHRAVSERIPAGTRGYVFGGCAAMAAKAMLASLARGVNVVDAESARRAGRGCTALQQAVGALHAEGRHAESARLFFARSRGYFELLLLDPSDVLAKAGREPRAYEPQEWAALLAVYVVDRLPVSHEQRAELKAIVQPPAADGEPAGP
jgi:hypothetical protein